MKHKISVLAVVLIFLSCFYGCKLRASDPQIMIYEAYTSGGYSSGENYSPYQNCYVVLYNFSEQPIKLDGWRLLTCDESGKVIGDRSAKLTGTINPKTFFVIQGGKAQEGLSRTIGELLPFHINLKVNSFSPQRKDGIIALSRSNKSGKITSETRDIEDYVAYGSINSSFSAFENPSVKKVLRRGGFENSAAFETKNIIDRPANIIRYTAGLTSELLSEMDLQTTAEISLSHSSGQYTGAFDLNLSSTLKDGGIIYYTTDGSSPVSPVGTLSKTAIKYTGPIKITDRKNEPRVTITSANISDYPWLPNKSSSEAEEDYYTRMTTLYNTVNRATIIKAAAINEDNIVTPTAVATYFVDSKSLTARYNMPVISIITDHASLYNEQTGLFMGENIWDTSDTGRVPAVIDYFENSSTPVFSDTVRLQIHGNTSRPLAQKSLRITMENDNFNFDLYNGTALDKNGQVITYFNNFILRQGGGDWAYGGMRDAFWQRYCSTLGTFGTQATEPATVYINGIYWGTYFITERQDDDYISSHYGLPAEDVTMVDFYTDIALREGDESEIKKLVDLRNFITGNDMSTAANYKRFTDAFDVESYIDYMLCEIFSQNSDWPENNTRIWKNSNPDATEYTKWTFLMCDLDASLKSVSSDYIENLINPSGEHIDNAKMFAALIRNAEFRNSFVSRGEYLLENFFDSGKILKLFDEMRGEMQTALVEHQARWGLKMNDWNWTDKTIRSNLDGWKSALKQTLTRINALA